MNVCTTIAELRQIRWRDPLASWGLVPTMGYLHQGHLALVHRACQENQRVGVSIFVNPTQFNNQSDLASYPRKVEQDLEMLAEAGVELVWTPTADIVYPPGFQTYVNVEQATQPLEGAARPGHFRGVTTVVAKLFNVFQPTRAYFGQKDAQQVVVIQRMVRDLNFNLEIVVCPTVREADGLAMSSRNARLSSAARQQAVCLFQALQVANTLIEQGEQDAALVRRQMANVIATYPLARIDYISVAHADTLAEVEQIERPLLISMAVYVDNVRLIDNIVVGHR